MILADYLTMLRSEELFLFDRMAAIHFEVLPKQLNKENLVTAIDLFGEVIMKGAVVDALEMVKEHARSVHPSWIVIRRLPRK